MKRLRKIFGLIFAVFLLASGYFGYLENTNEDGLSSLNTAAYSEAEELSFRNEKLLNEHFEKHGKKMGFSTASEYEKAASRVVSDEKALHKKEAEDKDDVYYIESTNEFVIVSTDGYIRTYFYPDSKKDYFDRQ